MGSRRKRRRWSQDEQQQKQKKKRHLFSLTHTPTHIQHGTHIHTPTQNSNRCVNVIRDNIFFSILCYTGTVKSNEERTKEITRCSNRDT